MAIETVFISFIVPIRIIEEKYLRGWTKCLEDHAELIGGRVWYDDYLFHDGAMSPADMGKIVEKWAAMGFDCYDEIDGQKYWKDVCVYEGMFGGATLPCNWLEADADNNYVSLKGAPVCKLVGPSTK
uniref:hypothetical protein n=1 Tax=Polynucleobacter sp. TaxID=2029855 RepID=UPI0040473ED4